jgi:hypothetical protein
MLGDKRLDEWTKWFLITAVATTGTGFFPFHGFTPALSLFHLLDMDAFWAAKSKQNLPTRPGQRCRLQHRI